MLLNKHATPLLIPSTLVGATAERPDWLTGGATLAVSGRANAISFAPTHFVRILYMS